MNHASINVNDAFTGVRARPVSHVAALAVLGALAFIAHEGIVAWVPGALGNALTLLFLAVAVLQWLGLGRKQACEDGRDHDRAGAVLTQAWIFGAIETALYAAGGLALLAAEGVEVYHLHWVVLAAATAAAAAFLNFRIKWVSCDPLDQAQPRGPTGGQRMHDVLFSTPALPAPATETARFTSDAGIIDFEDMLRRREAATGSDPRLLTTAALDAEERFRRWKKRESKRRQRAATA